MSSEPLATDSSPLVELVLNHHEYGCDLTEPPYERECSCSNAWRNMRARVLAFLEGVESIAAKRQRGYAERKHGDILNKECMDEIVALAGGGTVSENAGAIQAHSKTEYKRLKEQGANVAPPIQAALDTICPKPSAAPAERVIPEVSPELAARIDRWVDATHGKSEEPYDDPGFIAVNAVENELSARSSGAVAYELHADGTLTPPSAAPAAGETERFDKIADAARKEAERRLLERERDELREKVRTLEARLARWTTDA